jgi:hypothetical protein
MHAAQGIRFRTIFSFKDASLLLLGWDFCGQESVQLSADATLHLPCEILLLLHLSHQLWLGFYA